jgi:23S rRNA (adenine2503-C2)-methyltransferase
MEILEQYGRDDLARVYIARFRGAAGPSAEFVESVQPPHPRDRKWVLIVSSLFGCPIRCRMCDAGGSYSGPLSAEEIIAQADFMVRRRFPTGRIPIPKFKIQFARMGEPALNPAVLDALRLLPGAWDAPGLYVSLSSVGPAGRNPRNFFYELIMFKTALYGQGRFQLQFSIHTTDEGRRRDLIRTDLQSFKDLADFGRRFARTAEGDKKVTLNFAPLVSFPLDPDVIRRSFDPRYFMIKLTPLNPTIRAEREQLTSDLDPENPASGAFFVNRFQQAGFDVILSVGEHEENLIGSNCGQYIQAAIGGGPTPAGSYRIADYGPDQ